MSGAVNPNTPHSPPVCTMFKEIAQYLEFFHVFPQYYDNYVSVIVMTSSSDFGQCHEGVDLNFSYVPGQYIISNV